MTTVKLITKYAMHAEPATNQWWLTLELEDGSKPEAIRMSSAVELAAMLNILRHSRTVMFYPENNAIEIGYVPLGESAGEGKNGERGPARKPANKRPSKKKPGQDAADLSSLSPGLSEEEVQALTGEVTPTMAEHLKETSEQE